MNQHFNLSSSKIVLGHPLSGALYAYFDKVLNNSNHIKSTAWHGYYKTLYGKHFEYYIDISLALSLVFDIVILSEADNPIPDRHKFSTDTEYYNPDFGLYLSSANEIIHYEFMEEKVQYILQDEKIKALLSQIPAHAHQLIIREAYLDLELANKFNAPLFTIGIRQALVQRISEIERLNDTEFSKDHQINIVSNYLEITSLLFQPMDIDSFCYLKSDKDLKEYSKAFQNLINNFNPESPDIRKELLLNIKEAISKDSLNRKISGIFQGASQILNYSSLIPKIGMASSLIGISADAVAKGVDKINKNNKWYELASQINKTKSMEKLHKQLEIIK